MTPVTRRIFLAALLLLPAVPALAVDLGKENPRDDKNFPIAVTPALTALGVKATVATLKGEKPGPKETLRVFVTFDKGFVGDLQARAFRADDAEMARSALKRVKYKTHESGTIAFEFDKHSSFRLVQRFTLTGQAKTPGKNEGGFGDKLSIFQ